LLKETEQTSKKPVVKPKKMSGGHKEKLQAILQRVQRRREEKEEKGKIYANDFIIINMSASMLILTACFHGMVVAS
jgi:hypothetical protein